MKVRTIYSKMIQPAESNELRQGSESGVKPAGLADFAVGTVMVALIVIGLLWLAYLVAIRPAIGAAHRGTLPVAALNSLCAGRAEHPVSHYHAVAASWLRMISLIVMLLAPYFIWLKASARVKRRWLRAAATAAILFVLCEIFLRVMLATPGHPNDRLRNPALFANEYSSDLYWMAKIPWGRGEMPNPRRIHPLLGWSQTYVTPDNPLGLDAAPRAELSDPRENSILFYGDSYVRGFGDSQHQLPVLLQKDTPARQVVDLGVSGYGLDQISLMLRETIARFTNSTVLVGVMLYDLDRCALSFRHGQKPYFEADGSRLVLKGAPMIPDPAGYLAASRPFVASYFFRLLRTAALRAADIESEYTSERGRIEDITRLLVRDIKEHCVQNSASLRFVLFYPRWLLECESWRETFLKQELDTAGIAWLDTKPVLRDALRASPSAALYDHSNTHLINDGNILVANLLSAQLAR